MFVYFSFESGRVLLQPRLARLLLSGHEVRNNLERMSVGANFCSARWSGQVPSIPPGRSCLSVFSVCHHRLRRRLPPCRCIDVILRRGRESDRICLRCLFGKGPSCPSNRVPLVGIPQRKTTPTRMSVRAFLWSSACLALSDIMPVTAAGKRSQQSEADEGIRTRQGRRKRRQKLADERQTSNEG